MKEPAERESLFFYLTCHHISELLNHVLALVDPFSIALKEDLERRPGLTPQLDGIAFDDVGINRLLQEAGEGPRLTMMQGFTSGS